MPCRRHPLTRDNAHAHHIQRLMVLGNFALIAGIDPREVQDWYLVAYADAYEWVELLNVAAMILYADGGKLATKPYAASGNYINKMSNYCSDCKYSVSRRPKKTLPVQFALLALHGPPPRPVKATRASGASIPTGTGWTRTSGRPIGPGRAFRTP